MSLDKFCVPLKVLGFLLGSLDYTSESYKALWQQKSEQAKSTTLIPWTIIAIRLFLIF